MVLQAIESALPTMPTVLCQLIRIYAGPAQHRFRLNVDDVGFPTRIDDNGRKICHMDAGIELVDRWYNFASDVDFGSGVRNWIVVRPAGDGLCRCWFGAGVTTTASNIVSAGIKAADISTAESWIVRGIGPTVCCNNQFIDGESVSYDHTASAFLSSIKHRFPKSDFVEFRADAATLQVTAEFDDCRLILTAASSIDEFLRMRPVVVLAGRIDATVVCNDA